MENDLIILRYASGSAGTFGVALHKGTWLCHTLEPADRSGGRNCALRAGRYVLTYDWSPKFAALLPTILCPGRSGLRIHPGNYVRETSGCILPGTLRSDNMLISSRQAYNRLSAYIVEHHISHIHIIDYETLSI